MYAVFYDPLLIVSYYEAATLKVGTSLPAVTQRQSAFRCSAALLFVLQQELETYDTIRTAERRFVQTWKRPSQET